MNKLATYQMVLQESPLWEESDLLKLAADLGDLTKQDLRDARNKAHLAAGLHAVGHFGPGMLTMIPAGFVQRSAMQDAGIDYSQGGSGTFGAKHPIISGILPIGGTVSGFNAANRIDRKLRKYRKSLPED